MPPAPAPADGDVILPQHLPAKCRSDGTVSPGLEDDEIVTLEENERRYLLHVLATHNEDRDSLARRLGLSKRTLYWKLQNLRKDVSQRRD